MAIGRPPGQAAVEMVGIVAVVVLALAGATAWLLATARPPDRPPDVIGRVARPLAYPDVVRYRALPAVPLGAEGADEPIGDALRGLGRGARTATRTWLEGRRRFSGAYNRRLRERVLEVLRDPLRPPDLPGPELLTPEGLARRAIADAAAARDYVRRLRALPPGERWRALLGDSGAFAADATIDVVSALARRRAAAAAARRRPAHEPLPPPR